MHRPMLSEEHTIADTNNNLTGEGLHEIYVIQLRM